MFYRVFIDDSDKFTAESDGEKKMLKFSRHLARGQAKVTSDSQLPMTLFFAAPLQLTI